MQSFNFILTVTSFCILFFTINFLYISKDLLTTLIVVEGWWITVYFIFSFIAFYLSSATAVLLLPLILVFAGLEIVLGFYFLYFL